MSRKIIFFSLFICSLFISSCSNANKKGDKTKTTTSEEQKDTTTQQVANTAAQIMAKPQVPVLCYHRITDGSKGDYTVSPATFSAHMKVLADSGYHSISPTQLYDYLVYNKSLPANPVMISFDDSRIEHSTIAAPVMERNGMRGVFFIMTITYNKKNYMTTDEIAQLAKAGHTIGLHSWDHTMVTKYKEEADWKKQVEEPIAKLTKITGKPVEFWAHPNGVFNHESAVGLSKYFKLSFALSTKRDSIQPLQCVRRVIVPDMSTQALLKSMRRTFN